MATILGKQILWGVPGTTQLATITGSANLDLLQDYEFTRKAEKEKIKDTTGGTATLVYSDFEDTISFNFYPTCATAFATLAATSITSPGSTLAIGDVYTQWVSGTYAVDEFKQVRGNSKAMMWTFTLSRYVNATTIP